MQDGPFEYEDSWRLSLGYGGGESAYKLLVAALTCSRRKQGE